MHETDTKIHVIKVHLLFETDCLESSIQ